MERVEKTVFISYRRTNAAWALAIFQNLTSQGYDVFYDYEGIASGDFEQTIVGSIKARAHFLVLLTPSALERCDEPQDWLRREVETAVDSRRNIVPLMLERFDFGAPAVCERLTGKLASLKHYNALEVPTSYFLEAMERLRDEYLNVPLSAVLHPVSRATRQAAKHQQAAARSAPPVPADELTAQQCFEKGFAASDPAEKVRFYSEAIRLKPDYADAFMNRGIALRERKDIDGALRDYDEAIRLKPDFAEAYNNRGIARRQKKDTEGALRDFDQAIRIRSDYAFAYSNRGVARRDKRDLEGALSDFGEAIRLKPDYPDPYYNRAMVRLAKGDGDGASRDCEEAIRLRPDYAEGYRSRARLREQAGRHGEAVADLQRYLELGAGARNGDQAAVEQRIRTLRKKASGSRSPG